MLPLTAKFIARRQPSNAARMAQMLGVTGHMPLVDGLRDLLASTPGSTAVHARIACALDVVSILTTPTR
ncbi:hypothetical protein [Virgisporangium ochraceum]|nr:hypothetical protein [Virgisporangium ochraceum]